MDLLHSARFYTVKTGERVDVKLRELSYRGTRYKVTVSSSLGEKREFESRSFDEARAEYWAECFHRTRAQD